MSRERIVSAAIRMSGVGDGLIASMPSPKRHHHIMHIVYQGIGLVTSSSDQGFLTSAGRYVNRREALVIALDAGQLDKQAQGLPELFSEDL